MMKQINLQRLGGDGQVEGRRWRQQRGDEDKDEGFLLYCGDREQLISQL